VTDRAFQEPGYRATAGEFVRHVAETWGERELAVLGDERLTYREAERRSAELAKALLATGVRAG